MIDSTFEGQREAAIKEHEAGLTLIRDHFRRVPTAVSIDSGYADELWIKDSSFDEVTGTALLLGNPASARTEINLEGARCRDVPHFAGFQDADSAPMLKPIDGPSPIYRVGRFSHGLNVDDLGSTPHIETIFDAVPLASFGEALPPAIAPLPSGEWANLRQLGATGDGVTDDTAAIQHAIATHRVLYVPSGRYLVSDTIHLRPDTVLIGLHPSTTQFDLADRTPGFDGPGAPKALLEAPSGGTNMVIGIGLYTGGINSRASAAMWMSGKDSLMDDVRFLGGHGTNNPDGTRMQPYNDTHTGDPDPHRRWDAQYPSLWVLNGGGGTFANIWTPDTFAQAGLFISNTSTSGHVYELSSEHHVRNEVRLDHVANWEIVALQTEEEHGEGPFALPLAISNSKDILVANFHSYRVVGSYQPFREGVHVSNSQNIRFRNLHMYSDSKVSFDNSVRYGGPQQQGETAIRFREIGALNLSGEVGAAEPNPASTLLKAQVEKLADGFFNISGPAVDGAGRLYFVDSQKQRIFRWLPAEHRLEIVRDSPLDATNLAFDRAGNLMVISYAGNGTVYSFKPDPSLNELTQLEPVPAVPRPGLTALLPVNYWRNENDLPEAVAVPKPFQYLSPDGTTFLPAGSDFVSGSLYYGTKMADVLRAFSLSPADPTRPFYVSDEGEGRTWSAHVGLDGTLDSPRLFAEQGGEGLAVDAVGNVYIAAGQIYVYHPDGQLFGEIDTPERPIALAFGGPGHRTLFILARTSLYQVIDPLAR